MGEMWMGDEEQWQKSANVSGTGPGGKNFFEIEAYRTTATLL
jgi:hypothetical protein